ncbi:unnamed protein product [Durusdinium trenchii]|uniref:tRNA pseudouridine synthase n=1 Tax=Durusdinium trenchii TaxID=1381693 RepID=A0ABP0P5N5_9DINO
MPSACRGDPARLRLPRCALTLRALRGSGPLLCFFVSGLFMARPCFSSAQRWKLQVAYDGSNFHGWQPLKGLRTVQGTLLDALKRSHPEHGREVGDALQLVGCSRTDRGVHAEAQVAHCELRHLEGLTGDVLRRRCNRRLPSDVRVLQVEQVDRSFHARRSALRKSYRYDLLLADEASPFEARYVWPVGGLDLQRLASAAGSLDGQELDCRTLTVNWRSSCKAGTEVYDEDYYGPLQKQLRCRVTLDPARPERVSLWVEAEAFLFRMVRVIATALVACAREPLELEVNDPESFAATMECIKSRCNLAPPNGLFLQSITYAESGQSEEHLSLWRPVFWADSEHP